MDMDVPEIIELVIVVLRIVKEVLDAGLSTGVSDSVLRLLGV